MTRAIVTRPEQASAAEALTAMRRGRFRHLPVLRDGVLVGIVSDRDLQAAPDQTTLAELMHAPIAVSPGTPIEQAALLMEQHKIGSLTVVEDGSLVGLV